jgi:glycosyltransferase involved in cell wall biosynthesis
VPSGIALLVLDHRSTDRTAKIAADMGARVIARDFEGFVHARHFALAQVRTPWALMIDADEELDERLAGAILSAREDVNGFFIARTTFYRGRPLRMWKNELLMRLFRPSAVTLRALPAAGGTAQLHERWICSGPSAHLAGTLLHYSYPSREAYDEKFDAYTSLEAEGVAFSPAALAVETAKTPLRFAWYIVARGAGLDGLEGLRVAWASARYPMVVQWKARRSR